jgi:AAA+ ATPase superfamily predicted ATPase
MSDVNNPFLIYAYAGPKYFCDRIEETEHLISALRNGRNVTLMSPRRMGKTGLIQNVFHQIRRDYPEAACFYMDIFSTTCLDDFIIQFGQTVIGKLDNLSQKTLAAISGFFKNCRLVFFPDVLTGVPQATLDFQPS